jgi:hypothetical protein
LLSFLEPIHQHGVVGGFHPGAGQGIVADGVELGLPGSLHLLESALWRNTQEGIGIGGSFGHRDGHTYPIKGRLVSKQGFRTVKTCLL